MLRFASVLRLYALFVVTAAAAGCAGDGAGPELQTAALVPPAIPAANIAGRWGLAAYHRDEDRERTVAQARGLCGNAYEIGLGPNGGVLMHPADDDQRVELAVKGAAGNRTFVGPPGEPGGPLDREIVAYDGQVMIMRWMDPEIGARYGTIVFSRCPATAARPPASRAAPARTNR